MKQMYFQGLIPKGTKVKHSRAIELTDRDLEIIEYILDMKFVSIQNVYERFFKTTISGSPSVSNEWAVRRLQQLAKAKYINGVHSFSEREKFYLGTLEGYRVVAREKPSKTVLRPSLRINHHTFDHDRYVLKARIALENKKAATCWLSDKRLRANSELSGGLVMNNVPDGIFENECGEKVALEIELSGKSTVDYRRKISKYVYIIRSESSGEKVFSRVWYVCAKPWIYELIKKETKIYGNLFEVYSFEEFFDK